MRYGLKLSFEIETIRPILFVERVKLVDCFESVKLDFNNFGALEGERYLLVLQWSRPHCLSSTWIKVGMFISSLSTRELTLYSCSSSFNSSMIMLSLASD